jgi:hypothetical protein
MAGSTVREEFPPDVPALLDRIESERSESDREMLTAFRENAQKVYGLIAAEALPHPERILLRGELNEVYTALGNPPMEGNVNCACLPIEGQDPVVGLSVMAEDGRIAHELFHASIERGFLDEAHSEQLKHLAYFLEDVQAYNRYLRGENLIMGEEMRQAAYFSKPNELMGSIIQDYVNFVRRTEDSDGTYKGIDMLPPVWQYGGIDTLQGILTSYEAYIRKHDEAPAFTLGQREAFLDHLQTPDLSSGGEAVREAGAARDEFFAALRTLRTATGAGETTISPEELQKMAAQVNHASERIPGTSARLTWLESYLSEFDRICKEAGTERIYKLLEIDELRDMWAIAYDADRDEVYRELQMRAPKATPEEFLAHLRDDIEKARGEEAETKTKVSFEEFRKDPDKYT